MEYEDDEIRLVEPLECDVLRWAHLEVDASAASDPDEVLDAARSGLSDALAAAGDRPLAARVVVAGASRAHAALLRRAEHWTNEIRSVATDLGDVWAEKVKLQTRALTDRAALSERDDAVGALVRALEDLDWDSEAVTRYGAQLDALRLKLPPELVGGSEVSSAGDDEALVRALREARELLNTRLVGGGAS